MSYHYQWKSRNMCLETDIRFRVWKVNSTQIWVNLFKHFNRPTHIPPRMISVQTVDLSLSKCHCNTRGQTHRANRLYYSLFEVKSGVFARLIHFQNLIWSFFKSGYIPRNLKNIGRKKEKSQITKLQNKLDKKTKPTII